MIGALPLLLLGNRTRSASQNKLFLRKQKRLAVDDPKFALTVGEGQRRIGQDLEIVRRQPPPGVLGCIENIVRVIERRHRVVAPAAFRKSRAKRRPIEPIRPVKDDMLEHVRDAVLAVRIVRSADPNHDPQRDLFRLWHPIQNDVDAIRHLKHVDRGPRGEHRGREGHHRYHRALLRF